MDCVRFGLVELVALLQASHAIYLYTSTANRKTVYFFIKLFITAFQVTKLDDISPLIFLNRTKAALNCAAGSMQVSGCYA